MASKARQAMLGSRRDGTVTVIGATGQQGGAVIDALLRQRIHIRGHSKPARRQGSCARSARGGGGLGRPRGR